MATQPKSEYPRPQFVRKEWLCLNGSWEFEIDSGDSGLERGLLKSPFQQNILVPFCPESVLSGIGQRDFMNAVWYRKRVVIPLDWAGRDVLLHFQAVDYDSTVWVNGVEVYRHRGGFSPFTCELQFVPGATPGEEIEIVVRARDRHQKPQAMGKQSSDYEPKGCCYLRTTGIWQSVWMEPVSSCYLLRPRITPDLGRKAFRLELPLRRPRPGLRLRACLSDADGIIHSEEIAADLDFCPALTLPIPSDRVRLWKPGAGHLYPICIELLDKTGTILDKAESYGGLRSLTLDGSRFLINGQPIFQKLVLDQGYYPDGIMTAPTDEALERDILLSMEAGFNGARLHQKVFEERFLYHADRLGYLLWGEFGDWGCSLCGDQPDNQQPGASYITQWLEVLERDYSHPSIIGWCPLNETRQLWEDEICVLDDVTRGMFLATKLADRSRPVLDVSGYSHRVLESDIYDSHEYEQDPSIVAERYEGLRQDVALLNSGQIGRKWSVPYRGQPFFISEFGGIWWNPEAEENENSWGYGERPKNVEEFLERFRGLCRVLRKNPLIFGYCYTQLTDVFQEQNGIYTFDRKSKFNSQRLREAQSI